MFGKNEEKAEENGKEVNRMKSCKIGVDNRWDVCYNHQRCRESSKHAEETTTAILENDTEKQVILYKKMRSAETRDDASNSQILKELNALTKCLRQSALASGLRRAMELRIRIEHKSLILAQDERWRRA